ncbi:MAG: L,D-transpeptidase family protein [Chromatiales bacterium]|nr:L,D-transpeptidase family protein [Chromatiales bacterium]
MRAGALALALLLAATAAPGTPAQDPDWHIPLATGAGEPQHPDAVRLRDALARYQQLAAAGGWPELPAGTSLQPGQRDARVVALRDRLRIGGDFAGLPGTADAWFFDGGLQRAVQDFQARHGLPATGVPDERTIAALNVPAPERVRQLQSTLTRWSWLPRDFGPRYLWVNVPGGSLALVEDGTTTLAMRVIAGHPDRPTPSFQDTVTAIVENPSWSVPRTIAVEDLLPTQQEDPTFLARLGIRVFDGQGREQDATRIDWQRLSADRFPYRLRQDPGPLNSLGRLKFVLGNPWDIFLHDTPSRRLFDLNSRTLSSGCIRLENPEELARRLVGAPSGATLLPRESSPRVSSGRGVAPEGAPTRTVKLPRPIAIYVVYLTSWVTPEGVVNFRPDVYGRDARLR